MTVIPSKMMIVMLLAATLLISLAWVAPGDLWSTGGNGPAASCLASHVLMNGGYRPYFPPKPYVPIDPNMMQPCPTPVPAVPQSPFVQRPQGTPPYIYAASPSPAPIFTGRVNPIVTGG